MTQQQEIATLRGHTGDVSALAFSPDGTLLASGSADSTVRLWDVASHQEVAVLRGHTGAISTVVFSPDGQLLVSASTQWAYGGPDNTVRLWDVASHQEVAVLRGYTSEAGVVGFTGAAAFHPAEAILALGSLDGAIYLWDVARQREVGIIEGPVDEASSILIFSPDGRTLASASGDGTVVLRRMMPTAVEPSSVDVLSSALPRRTALLPAYPNPGNPGVWLPYELAKDAEVTIRIYNVVGQVVRTLEVGRRVAGRYLSRGSAAFWDGRTAGGE